MIGSARIAAALVLVSALAPAHARAGCAAVDMDAKGGSMERVPVLDQDALNGCYAYAGTGLFMAYRLSKSKADPEHVTSPIAAAIGSGLDKGKAFIGSGHACDVVNYLKDKGSCDRRKVLEQITHKCIAMDETYHDVLLEAFGDYRKAAAGKALGEKAGFREAVAARMAACLREMAPDGVLPGVLKIADLLDQEKSLVFLQGLVAQACPDSSLAKWNLPAFECKNENMTKRPLADVLKTIHERLDLPEPQPIAFSHCTMLLQEDDDAPKGVDHDAGALTKLCDHSRHVALITGRRVDPDDPKRCQLRVRNEWGTDCEGYYSNLWDCKDGSLWIDDEALAHNTYALQYIVEPKPPEAK
ncbi:MAG: hypothetical protein HY075_11625 [Deltaproteobacteria bacterium]|nr:hypothetical protein [Deltaproteobacteria bacterium]